MAVCDCTRLDQPKPLRVARGKRVELFTLKVWTCSSSQNCHIVAITRIRQPAGYFAVCISSCLWSRALWALLDKLAALFLSALFASRAAAAEDEEEETGRAWSRTSLPGHLFASLSNTNYNRPVLSWSWNRQKNKKGMDAARALAVCLMLQKMCTQTWEKQGNEMIVWKLVRFLKVHVARANCVKTRKLVLSHFALTVWWPFKIAVSVEPFFFSSFRRLMEF